MELKGIYKIGDLQLTNLTYFVSSVTDNIIDKICFVEVIFEDDKVKYSRSFEGFTYTNSWEDSDVETWVTNELISMEIV